VRHRYPLDYWGLSCREGLERLLRRDPSPTLRVSVETPDLCFSAQLLPPEQRRRLRFVTRRNEADYYVTRYLDPDDPAPGREEEAVVVDGAKVLSVWKLNEDDRRATSRLGPRGKAWRRRRWAAPGRGRRIGRRRRNPRPRGP